MPRRHRLISVWVVVTLAATVTAIAWLSRGEAAQPDPVTHAPAASDAGWRLSSAAQPTSERLDAMTDEPPPPGSERCEVALRNIEDRTSPGAGIEVAFESSGRTHSTSTDEQGRVWTDAGSTRARVLSPQWSTIDDSLVARPDATAILWVRRLGALTVRAVDATDAPIPSARISLHGTVPDTRRRLCETTDEDGIARFSPVAMGQGAVLTATAVGRTPVQLDVVVGPEPITVVLPAVRIVDPTVIRCVDPDDGAVQDVNVRLRSETYGDREVWLGETDAHGELRTGTSLPPGQIWLDGPIWPARVHMPTSPPPLLELVVHRAIAASLVLDDAPAPTSVEARILDGVDHEVRELRSRPYRDEDVARRIDFEPRIEDRRSSLQRSGGNFPIELPKGRAVHLTLTHEGIEVGAGIVTANREGATVHVAATAMATTEHANYSALFVEHSGQIQRVEAGPARVARTRNGFRVSSPSALIACQVHGTDASFHYSGRLQAEREAVIPVSFPETSKVSVRVQDQLGEPVEDARLVFRRVSDRTREPIEGTQLKRYLANEQTEVAIGAAGTGIARLPHGEYVIECGHLPTRSGPRWAVRSPESLIVDGDTTTVVVTDRPRVVTVDVSALGSAAPVRWRIHDREGRLIQSVRGARARLWLTQSAHELQLRDANGNRYRDVLVEAGSGPARIDVR
ncbi:MAG: carboxypeptidase regulatory-like domain-containing protein, partial [Planctomycetes bacterium]|nr:carboxypeptidase regulatory-like domain-containing protein [Planctomycetota bacterium]